MEAGKSYLWQKKQLLILCKTVFMFIVRTQYKVW